jgi:hypothetical protein
MPLTMFQILMVMGSRLLMCDVGGEMGVWCVVLGSGIVLQCKYVKKCAAKRCVVVGYDVGDSRETCLTMKGHSDDMFNKLLLF